MKTALFPGSFAPPTLGHLDIIKRSRSVCDKLYVGVAVNVSKSKTAFSVEEKVEMLKTICRPYPHVEVVSFSGLVVDFAKKNGIDFLIRGLRAFSDFEYEHRMALVNRKIGQMETFFLTADTSVTHISSSLIHELASHHSRLLDFVPKEIEDKVFQKLSSIRP